MSFFDQVALFMGVMFFLAALSVRKLARTDTAKTAAKHAAGHFLGKWFK